uniref:Globin family profile domain-containing protein n=1 Tax=Onchocerca volvulus TaxID=6282 RepID=A0A8R1Y0Z7_ONCVO
MAKVLIMGNTGSAGSGTKEQSRIDFSDSDLIASSSRINSPKKFGQTIPLKNPRLSISSQGRKISALTLSQRNIVKGCMDKAKDDIAERIYRRIAEKREDFRKFVEALSEEERIELANALRNYLKNVVNQLADGANVQRISEDFGARHVQYRTFGFRPDFFATTADAVTTECVLLDAAIHPASEALFAWSTLTAFMFSSVRDGYYNEQRRIRKTSQINRSKISLVDAPDEMLNPSVRKSSNLSYNPKLHVECVATDEMDELESKMIIKRMEDDMIQSQPKVATGTLTERLEISGPKKKSRSPIQTERMIAAEFDKRLRIASNGRRNSAI